MNLLNNREIETSNDKVWEEEAKSVWSFWLAMGQMGGASQIKPTQADVKTLGSFGGSMTRLIPSSRKPSFSRATKENGGIECSLL